MAGKKEKEVTTRLVRGQYNLGDLQGPYYVKGSLGNKMPRVNEPVWYDPDSNQFFFRDGTRAFDAVATDYLPPPVSARSIEREKLAKKLAEAQAALNSATIDLKSATRATDRRKLREEIAQAKKQRDDFAKQLEAVKTSTQKLDERGGAVEVRPPFGRGVIQQGGLPILGEYDRKEDKIKLFFPGAAQEEKGKKVPLLSANVKNVLSQYAESTTGSRGELGYWAVSSWDYPAVLRELKKMPGVRVLGAPQLDLDKKFKAIDMRARSVKDSSLLIPDDFPPKVGHYPDGKPADFQREGIKFLMSRDQAILADDMGLGKTYQAIIAAHSSVPKSEQILILCPAAVIGSWLGDIKKFAPGAAAIGFNTKYVNEKGLPSPRPEKVRFFVCSYQGASSQEGKAAVSKLILNRKWGLVILDEARRLKRPDTLGHKFVEKIKTNRMWFMTGTPIANKVIDYYGLLKLAHHPIGKSLEKFIENYVPGSIKAGKVEVATETEPLERLGRDLVGYVLRRTKEEVLKEDLPEKFGGIAQAPRGFLLAELPKGFADWLVMKKEEGIPRERLRHALAVAKVPGTWEVAQRVIDAGDKVVLFSTYTDVIHSFAELCHDAKVLFVVISGEVSTIGKSAMVKLFQGVPLSTGKDQNEEKWAQKNLGQWFLNLVRYVPVSEWKKEDIAEATRRFGNDERKWPHEIQVVLGQMVAASEGVTLTKADTLLFNDLDYMPSRHEQAEDRIYRLSAPGIPLPHKAVYIGYMVSNDPLEIDAGILVGLSAKRKEIQLVYSSTSKDVKGEYAKLRDKYVKDLHKADKLQQAKKRNPKDTLGM